MTGLKIIDGTPTAMSKYLREREKDISLCSTCNCMTKSIPSYKEILKPKYKKINYLICWECKAVKFK